MVRGQTGTPARMCAVTIAVQHLLCSGDRGGTTTFQRRRHHSREPGISRQRKWGRTGRDTAGSGAEGSMGMLYADDAGIVSRSPAGLARMMTVIVEVLSAFGLTVSEKTETLLMQAPEKAQQPGETPTPPLPALEIAAAGQKYHQVHQFVYLGGLIIEDADITRDINRRTKIAWGCFRKFSTELFDKPNAPLRLKARLLKAEAMEALLYGCMAWTPRNAHYRQLRMTYHKLLPRVIGYHRVHGTYRKISYAKALKKTGSQSVEATIRQRRLLFAGALARQGGKRLPKRLLFAERLEGGEDPGSGARPPGTALAEKLEGRLQGIRSSTRLHPN